MLPLVMGVVNFTIVTPQRVTVGAAVRRVEI
jgi:hypothetical protein